MRGRHGDHVPSAYSVNVLSSNASQRISNGLPEDNLRLLASQCSNATPMNKNGASDAASSIPIATPVPLPYTARSSTVLYSMISGSKENIQHPLTLVEQLEESRQEMETCHPIPIERDNPSHASTYLLDPQQHNVATSRGSSTHTFRPIRPISPSTLIALTEPFLMAWSMRIPTPSRPALPSLSTIPPIPHISTLHAPSRIDLAHSAVHMQAQNAWGY